jgi:glycosyltransferase involved in cell wall biosynthesis
MRILRIAQDVFPDTIGGAPYHIHALSRDQAAMGHDVDLFTVSEDVEKPDVEERDGYTLVRHRPLAEIAGNKLCTDTLSTLRGADEYDVVHAHSHLYFSSNLAALHSTLSDVPLALTCHGLISQRVPEWVSKVHLRSVGKFTYNSADVNFCYTEEEKRRLCELGVDSDIRIVPNGIDPERFSPEGEEYEPLRETDDTVMLFVGRLVEGKRPDVVLRAFERLADDHPEMRLYFCGDGSMRESLEDRVERKRLGDRVEFLGYVPYEEMPAMYRAADVFVLPSRTEGFPRTVMESLACETPVISSRLEQIVSVVEQAGRVVDGSSDEALASAVESLANDPARRAELGKRGREMVLDRFNWADTVERTTAAIEETLESR